jgi:hypothetical protein
MTVTKGRCGVPDDDSGRITHSGATAVTPGAPDSSDVGKPVLLKLGAVIRHRLSSDGVVNAVWPSLRGVDIYPTSASAYS